MAQAHLTVDLQAGGITLASVNVPMTLTAGEPKGSGTIPINADTTDLLARLTRGIEAFTTAVQ